MFSWWEKPKKAAILKRLRVMEDGKLYLKLPGSPKGQLHFELQAQRHIILWRSEMMIIPLDTGLHLEILHSVVRTS